MCCYHPLLKISYWHIYQRMINELSFQMSDYLTFIQLKAQGADSVKCLLVQNEIESRKWMFGIVFNNTNLVHQYMFKLNKTKFVVKVYRNLLFHTSLFSQICYLMKNASFWKFPLRRENSSIGTHQSVDSQKAHKVTEYIPISKKLH